MKTIREIDYLSGNLNLVIDEKNKIVIGRLVVYDYMSDNLLSFKATALCDNEDTFNETTGTNIVKLKLAKQYYTYKRDIAKYAKEEANNVLKLASIDYDRSTKKLDNITNSLKKYGLEFYK